jgi:acyl-coenzyme A thioesterase PaaI-like protein
MQGVGKSAVGTLPQTGRHFLRGETMRYRVEGKQPNSSMCLVCGLQNSFGLHASFYELDSGELLALFKPREEHQGYPGRLHGGLAATLLDETIGRAIMVREDGEVWGVSVELTTRFRKPVPLGGDVRVVGRITKNSSRLFEGSGELLLEDGSVAVSGRGKYIKMPLDKIADFNTGQHWGIVPSPQDPEEFEF